MFCEWVALMASVAGEQTETAETVCVCVCLGWAEGSGLDRCLPDGGDGGGVSHGADPGCESSGRDRVCLEHSSRWRQNGHL